MNYYNAKDCNISELVGKTITSIRGMKKDNDMITFICNDGSEYVMYHEQDCCESVYIEDVCGNVESLLNSPILQAKESTSNDRPLNKEDEEYGTFTWTFYTLATINGYVDLRWYGTSNGYYSESVDFKQIKKENTIDDAIELLDKEFRLYAAPNEEYAINMAIDALKERSKANGQL